MADQASLDWPGYFRGLHAHEARALATWLGAQGLQLGEFMELVDRAYARRHERWRGRQDAFIHLVGTPVARRYALRKRHFARLVALLEAAMLSGAMSGEVAPHELDLPVADLTEVRPTEELLAALERVSNSRS
jgi:hypothetical protein